MHYFENIALKDQIITDAESFLVKCISPNCCIECFDELRHKTYYDKTFSFNLEKFPPTSESIRQPIKQTHLQYYLWFHLSFTADVKLNPLEYGYVEDDNEHLILLIISGNHIPGNFSLPCNCLKRARANACSCRIKQIACYKCEAAEPCKNPLSNTG